MLLRALVLFVSLFLSLPAFAQNDIATVSNERHVLLRLHADATAAVPGKPLRLAFEQTIEPGWHTYWSNPGDSGEPMRVEWSLPDGAKAGEILWPAPDRVPYGPLMNFGYQDHAVMLSVLDVPANAVLGSTLSIKADVTTLVCDEICIPESDVLTLDIPVATSSAPANEALFADAASKLPLMLDWKTVTDYNADEVKVRITLPASEAGLGDKTQDMIWFPFEWGYIENASDQVATYEASTRTLTLHQKATSDRDISKLDNVSYLVRVGDQSFIVGGAIMRADAPVMFDSEAMQPDMPSSLPLILVFALLGGLILNIMPCVFPILSMKALHLVSLPREQRTHAQIQGILYAAGVIVMFLALAAILIAIREAGAQVGWGFQLQNPAVVAGLAWLMFVIGLNLAGVFDLHIAFGGDLLIAERHHPLLSSFLTGVLATLVATPCSAPFMATAMGAALVQPEPIALLIFAFVGLGLALPYVLLCFAPVLQKLLPRPGAWMEIFRQLLAFPMFASAVWLVWVVAQQGGSMAVGWTLAGMVTLAFAIWMLDLKAAKKSTRRVLTLLGVILIGLTLWNLQLVVPVASDTEADVETVNYQPYDTSAFEQTLQTTNMPVFVNMTAAWCITCLVNEKAVLSTPEAKDLFAANKVVYFKGDWTNKDAAITGFLNHYGRSGVPLYVYFGPSENGDTRPTGKILPQILTIDELKGLFPATPIAATGEMDE